MLYNKSVKAFTLIELLAVIVILAIIALIATPIILGVISDSKEKAFRLSLKNVEHAYEIYETQHNIEPGTLVDIKDLPLDSKNLTGKVTTNKDGKTELKQVTDGTFSAEGTLDNLTIIKGPVDKLVEHKLDVKININFLSKSIVATVDLVGEGIPKKYVYKIEGSDKNETITKEVGKDETPENHTFDNLTIGEEYTVKVYVTNSTGKTTKEETKTGKTIDPTPTITLTPTGKTYKTSDNTTYMTSGKVKITYPSNEYKNYYRWDDWEDERFEEYTGEIEAKNGIITAIVVDGEETTSSTQTITTIDTEGPIITKIKKSGLKVTIQATDTLSGIKEYKCGSSSWNTSNECEFEEEGTYIIKVRDNLENPTTREVKILKNSVSEPVLGSLTPVVYNGTNWVVANENSDWYNYDEQQWANAVLLKSGVTKEEGETVDVTSEVQAMFVWVPRYEYKIEGQYGTHPDGTEGTKDLPGEIEVNFISKDTVYEGTNSEGYRIHPAFWWDDNSDGVRDSGEELDGIWVGKFETTGTTSAPTILPSQTSLRGQTVNVFRTTAQKFVITGFDSHMAKNSEWGVAAYLSQSKYGKYGNPNYEGAEKEVRINNCYSGSTSGSSLVLKTGIGANSQSEARSTTTCTTNTYETENGMAASTTGNITGIYDMSGGAMEYVMGVYNKTVKDSGINFSSLDAKYYDNYTTTTPTTACKDENGVSGVCYGHALSETSKWYGDRGDFVSSDYPWLVRGDFYSGSGSAGVFSLRADRGGDWVSNNYWSFRVALSHIN